MNKAEILVIDDEPQIRKLLEITLESNDYKIAEELIEELFSDNFKNKISK